MINWFEKHSRITVTVAIIIALAIFYISSITFPQEKGGNITSNSATTYHIGIFFLLSLFMLLGLEKRKEFRLIPIIILLAGVYAALDELHQYFVPGRYCSLTDFLIDLAGILVALGLYLMLTKYQNLKTRKNISVNGRSKRSEISK